MISTELLSEVLGIDVAKIIENSDRNISIYERDFKYPMSYNASAYLTINIYELAHKCKEYARSHDYYIESVVFEYGSRSFVHRKYIEGPLQILNDNNEPAVIFKAAEYIMQNLK